MRPGSLIAPTTWPSTDTLAWLTRWTTARTRSHSAASAEIMLSMARTLITVAPTGAEAAKADAPALPVTIEELVHAAEECERAGAAVVHVHIRDDEAKPTLDPIRLRDTVAALRERTDLIVQLSTGG